MAKRISALAAALGAGKGHVLPSGLLLH